MQVFAAYGYAVLMPGIPLTNEIKDMNPMADMMPAIDTALDAAIDTGFVDPNRLALSGQSYGGFTALAVAAQSDRFHAIIAMAGIANFSAAMANSMNMHGSQPAVAPQ